MRYVVECGKASARIALCLDCYNYRGGWRDYRGTVDSEPESEDAATGTARAARAASGSSSGDRRGAGQGGRVGHHDNDEREHANAPILSCQLYMFYYILGRVGFFGAG